MILLYREGRRLLVGLKTSPSCSLRLLRGRNKRGRLWTRHHPSSQTPPLTTLAVTRCRGPLLRPSLLDSPSGEPPLGAEGGAHPRRHGKNPRIPAMHRASDVALVLRQLRVTARSDALTQDFTRRGSTSGFTSPARSRHGTASWNKGGGTESRPNRSPRLAL